MPSYKLNTKTLWFAILQTIVFYANAQNLVSNGYFEIYDTCVTNQGQINYAVGWHGCNESPDYYDACSNGANMKVPYAAFGYQQDCCGGGGMPEVLCLIKIAQIIVIEIT